MSIDAESGLRVLAINILGRFLLSRDNNIRALTGSQTLVTYTLLAVGMDWFMIASTVSSIWVQVGDISKLQFVGIGYMCMAIWTGWLVIMTHKRSGSAELEVNVNFGKLSSCQFSTVRVEEHYIDYTESYLCHWWNLLLDHRFLLDILGKDVEADAQLRWALFSCDAMVGKTPNVSFTVFV